MGKKKMSWVTKEQKEEVYDKLKETRDWLSDQVER